MQAAPIVTTAAQTGGADPIAESTASGQGIRIGSAQQKTHDSLFTAILQHGIALSGGEVSGAEAVGPEDSEKGNEIYGESADVCGLLMQLMVLNAPAQAASGGGTQETAAASSAVAGEIVLSGAAATMALPANQAAANSTAGAGSAGAGAFAPNAEPEGTQHQTTVLDGITAALQNEAQASGADAEQPATAGVTASDAASAGAPASEAAQVQGIAVRQLVRDAADTAAGQPKAPGNRQADGKSASAIGGDAAAGPGPLGAGQGTASAAKETGSGETGGGNAGEGPILSRRTQSKDDETNLAGMQPAAEPAGTRLTGAAAAGKAAAAEKALRRFEQDLRGLQNGKHEIKIVLEPESLGVLTISVIKTESGISAKIKSEDREVVAAINDQLQKLISSMESKGIRLEDVDVAYSQAGQSGGFGQHDFSRGDGAPGSYSAPSRQGQTGDAPEEEPWSEAFGGQAGDSTVDYTV